MGGKRTRPHASQLLDDDDVAAERIEERPGVLIGHRCGEGHEPRNSGGRFSAKAASPSTASSEVRQ